MTPQEEYADTLLVSYAMRHTASEGRLFAEEPDPYRTCFQRDRDRIIHSKAFRRLGYKTQVFANSEGDNYRTRLTHSLEVAQLSRSVACTLRLNQDYTECLALAHDLGHTPFGHAGQDTLHALMKAHGGFEHNCQSLRIVAELETRYLDFNGLNLTLATLAGMMKHTRIYTCDTSLEEICQKRSQESPNLEAALVDICDQVAYLHHDLEDGLDSNLLKVEELTEITLWRDTQQTVAATHNETLQAARPQVRFRFLLKQMLSHCIQDLITETRRQLDQQNPQTLQDITALKPQDHPLRFSAPLQKNLKQLRTFLFERLYRHPSVNQMARRGARIIQLLFTEYSQHPEILPRHVQARIPQHGLHRVVSDYISGMTDRFAAQAYSYLMLL